MCHKIIARCLPPLLSLLIAGLLAACKEKPVLYSYCSTPVEGWESVDTLKYHVDTLSSSGTYEMSIGVRTSATTLYPYQSLWLVMRQSWHNPDRTTTDTLQLQFTNAKGDVEGHGVSIYQFDFPLAALQLPAGASADIRITHIMSRELLPGITDIGVKLQKQ